MGDRRTRQSRRSGGSKLPVAIVAVVGAVAVAAIGGYAYQKGRKEKLRSQKVASLLARAADAEKAGRTEEAAQLFGKAAKMGDERARKEADRVRQALALRREEAPAARGEAKAEVQPEAKPPAAEPSLTAEKWVYISHNFAHEKNVDLVIDALTRAAKVGYNGVLLTDCKFFRWNEVQRPQYDDNVRRLRRSCRDLGMKVIAVVCGQGTDLLSNDPNLAEGMPVVDAPFVARGGRLVPVDADLKITNPSFEELARENQPTGWTVDEPGRVCFIDTDVKCHGEASLRIQDIRPKSPHGNGRANQRVKVKPFRYYHLTVMVRTDGFVAPRTVNVMALGKQGLVHAHFAIAPSQDWKKVEIVFNTLGNEEIGVYVGSWGGGGGKIWFDDIRVESGGIVNLLRREGAPFKMTSEDGGTVYEEGRDFAGAKDPKLGLAHNITGIYDFWHEPPAMTVPAVSRITEGEKVLVSYSHSVVIYGYSTMVCMNEPKIWELTAWHLRNVHEVVEPDAYMMPHDEIRHQGWDESCKKAGLPVSKVLAENVRRCTEMIRKEDPGKPIYVWSDMFDPNHNAKRTGYYYLVKGEGPWHGGWEGLDKDVIVVNWNGGQGRKESLKWFADRGHKQILAGYYDAPVGNVTPWLNEATEVDGVIGVVYTTWSNDYSKLEAFMEKIREFEGK